FANSSGNFERMCDLVAEVIDRQHTGHGPPASVQQLDAVSSSQMHGAFVSTDPPYYDNIGYGDLSDFFYVWLRKNLGKIFPDLFSTVLVPKKAELVATPYRFGGDKNKAKKFFEEGLGAAFVQLREVASPEFPVTIFYA